MNHCRMAWALLSIWGLMACAKQIPANHYQTNFPHNKEQWVTWRALVTNATPQDIEQADQAMGPGNKPANYGADYQRKEGRALWQFHCVACHGTSGNDNPQKLSPAPRKLGGMGIKMGFFFGGDKMRAGIFKKIQTGQSSKQKTSAKMVGFRDLLHNEQIWSLVYHLENL